MSGASSGIADILRHNQESSAKASAMHPSTVFKKLNSQWNAEPNAPDLRIEWLGENLQLSFLMNPWQYEGFIEGDVGLLVFRNCSQYRLGNPNDEGFYIHGDHRFHGIPHEWGEFYEVQGDLRLGRLRDSWKQRVNDVEARQHFLFYFKDGCFECEAIDWQLTVIRGEAVVRTY